MEKPDTANPGENHAGVTGRARRMAALLGPSGCVWVAASVLVGLVASALELVVTVAFGRTLQAAATLRPQASIPPLLMLLGFSAARLIVAGIGQGLALKVNLVVTERIRLASAADLLFAPHGAQNAAEKLLVRFHEHAARVAYFWQLATAGLCSAVQGLALCVLILARAPRQGGATLVTLALVGFVAYRIARGNRRFGESALSAQHRTAELFERITHNQLLIRSLRTEQREYRNLAKLVAEHGLLLQRNLLRASAVSIASVALAGGPLLAFVLVAQVDIVTRLVVVYALVRLATLAAALVKSAALMQSLVPTIAAAERDLSSVKHLRSDSRMANVAATGERTPAISTPCELRFEGVSFAYVADGRSVIHSVSFATSPGELLGICGPSGAGKTTLVQLALGLLAPLQGRVTVDGLPPALYFGDAGGRGAYVHSDPFLFSGTVRENLTYAFTTAHFEDAELFDVLALCHLEREVRALPGGLDFRLGEKGDGLSLGQKQRLALARALLSGPNMLVLDEATSNLDASVERAVLAAVEGLKGKTTCLIVSHRQEVLSMCERCLCLDSGGGASLTG